MRDNTIKKTIIKIAYFIVVFVIALFVVGKLSNKDNADMTAKMPPATLPIISVSSNGVAVNPLHGYLSEVDPSYIRGTVWPISVDRKMSFSINTYGQNVWNIGYEVRSIDGKNLVENAELSDYKEKDGVLNCNIQLKDLIVQGREYMLVIKMDTDNGVARYYTRVVWTTDENRYYIDEEIDFIQKFSGATFIKDAAKENHEKYCEYKGDKKDTVSFDKVDIKSNFESFSWYGLKIANHTAPQVYVTDIHGSTGCFKLQYRVTINDDELGGDYNVTECYRVKYNQKKMQLLNYERTMNYIFDPNEYKIEKNVISLGICDPSFELKENNDGSSFAFVNEGRLFSYNNNDKKLAYIFGFYDDYNDDARSRWDNSFIKVLNINEGGDVRFAVSGYMNRGIHEGKVGIVVYDYNAALNSVEEQAFIGCNQSAEILNGYVDTLAYANGSDIFYTMMDQNIYEVNLSDKTAKAVADIGSGSYKVSESKEIIAWQSDDHKQVDILNLSTGAKTKVPAENGDDIVALCFAGEDIVTGLVHEADVAKDTMGNEIYPIYKIVIRDKNGENMREYDKSSEGIYETDAESTNENIFLTRVVKNANGAFESTTGDILQNSLEKIEGKNTVTQETRTLSGGEANGKSDSKESLSMKVVHINTDGDIGTKLRVLSPNQVLFEDKRDVEVESERDVEKNSFYYVYDIAGKVKIFADPAKAVIDAHGKAGVVMGDKNNYIWYAGVYNYYQLQTIIKMADSYEGKGTKSSVTTCLDLILKYNGVDRDVDSLLKGGQSVADVLSTSMPTADVLDMDGCSLDSVKYYIVKDIPVMALLNNDEALLILGFDEKNYILMDPNTGKAYKKGKSEAADMFEENGNHFITYIPEEK